MIERKPLFFNFQKICIKAGNSPAKILKLLQQQYTTPYSDYLGDSFLLNTDVLFLTNHTTALIVNYVAYASMRNYAKVVSSGNARLPVVYIDDQNAITKNPMLRISNGEIYFKYEELYYGTKILTN